MRVRTRARVCRVRVSQFDPVAKLSALARALSQTRYGIGHSSLLVARRRNIRAGLDQNLASICIHISSSHYLEGGDAGAVACLDHL